MNHATCTVVFQRPVKPHWLEALAAKSALQINRLTEELGTDASYKFSQSMIYRMVGTLADFAPEYRALHEIILNSKTMEACGKVDFRLAKTSEETVFHTHPAYIDAFSQLAGFVMNANEHTDLETEVFVNHGWGSLQLYEDIRADRAYLSCVKMILMEDSIWEGTLAILDGDRLIGILEGIRVSCRVSL